jgi:16S rRNA processing protein RimM
LPICDCHQSIHQSINNQINNQQSTISNLFVMEWNDMALVGRIARAHGIRGQVVVNPDTDFPEQRFRPGVEFFIERRGSVEAIRVTTVRFQHERPVLGIEGIDTMTDAESLAGCELRVPVESLAELPEGTFYRHELIGCRVETRGGDTVGVVTDVEGTQAGSRLIVDGARGEVQVPLATEICTTIDVATKRIVIEPPEGLLELNAGSV